MDLLLTDRTALAFWRNSLALGANALVQRNAAPKSAPAGVPDFALDTIRRLTFEDGPVHILISDATKRGRRRGVAYHVHSTPLPPSTLCRIGALDGLDIAVASPELCFIQMARDLDFVRHLQLGFELCGTYRTHVVTPSDPITRYNMLPLASIESLKRTAALLAGTPHVNQATHSCGLILDNSASPAETALAILLTSPNALGGYGLPQPLLNAEHTAALPRPFIHAPEESGSANLDIRTFRPDLYRPGRNVAVEYDSREFHSQPDAMTSNAIRYNDLQELDFTAFIATIGQLRSLRESDKLALQIGRALGVRQRIRCKDFRLKQQRLRQMLGFAGSCF